MDPDVCFAELLAALSEGRVQDSCESARHLARWIKNGGFKPKGLERALRPAMKVRESAIEVSTQVDDDADTSYLDQPGFEDRRVALQRGEFSYISVFAEVELLIPHGDQGHSIVQHISSPGLWGIESDIDKEHIDGFRENERKILKDMLEALGVEVVK